MAQADSDHNTIDRHLQALEIFNLWMALDLTEKEQFVRQIRDEVPMAPEIADAFERHYRSLRARA